ncbi:MAG: Metal dependent phosphohydrolase, partial [Parcubacteria group bacterium LiPW_39]
MKNEKSLHKVSSIKKLVAKECAVLGFVPDWFFKTHILGVEKFAKKLLKKFPQADKKSVMLGVYLHDLQRIRGLKGDHEKLGALEAMKVMDKFSYSQAEINRVKEIIETHAYRKLTPKTLEGKILATADAMSHYINDFYLTIATTGERNLGEFKKWALEKINRDYNKKIF